MLKLQFVLQLTWSIQQNQERGKSVLLKQKLYQMHKNLQIKESSESLPMNLESIPKSITETFCPKYRKFINFNDQTNFQSKQVIPQNLIDQPNQQADSKNQDEKQQSAAVPRSSHQYKNVQTVSMIDINQSTQIPPLDDKKLTFKHQSLGSDGSITQQSFGSPLPNLKLRKQFSKIRYSNASLTEDELKYQIKDHFNQLNSIIEKTSTHFQKRMKTHEDELLKIMMMEIKRVNQECQRTISKYNNLIRSKAISQQIDEARLETMFFRSQALQLKKQNEELKKEIKYLKRLNNEYELKVKTDSQILKQMGSKLMSYKKRNQSIQKTLLDQSISKKIEKLKQHTPEKQTYLQINPNHSSVLEGSKISCVHQVNSKSLQNRNLTVFQSGQKSLTSMRMRTEFVSCASSDTNLTRSLAMKLNREINKKYKIGKQVQQFCAVSPTNKNEYLSEIIEKNDSIEGQGNRQKIMRFLKQARPSIKSIIQQKKTNDKKPMRKLTHQPIQKELDKIIIIKNKVRLSTFEQQRWQQFKSSSLEEHELSEKVN